MCWNGSRIWVYSSKWKRKRKKDELSSAVNIIIRKMYQNDHPINFPKPRTATSDHSYDLRASNNNRNIVYVDRSCCPTQRSGSFISFAGKYVNMYIVI